MMYWKIKAFLKAKGIVPGRDDFTLVDDGSGAKIETWDEAKLGPEPTDAELAAVDGSFEEARFLAGRRLTETDTGTTRVLDDLVDTLIRKGVISLTDLPVAAQDKLNERIGLRASLG
jgi:intein/homing endonuclease